jgi:hypothetical protein
MFSSSWMIALAWLNAGSASTLSPAPEPNWFRTAEYARYTSTM